jgi:HEPN domain-containing protein
MCGRATVNTPDQRVVESITAAIARLTEADKIYLLSQAPASRYDFLVLLPGKAQLSFVHYQRIVEEECRKYGTVILWCCHTTRACKFLAAGHIFYSLACNPQMLLYDSGRPLPKPIIDVGAAIMQAEDAFYPLMAIARSFLDGAQYHSAKGQLRAAAFSLHQATEHALRALLFTLTGFNGRGHNLHLLLWHCSYCAPPLCRLFPQETEADKATLLLLKNAYLHARYKVHYLVKPSQLDELLVRVESLHVQALALFEERIITFKTYATCQMKSS